MRIAHALLGEAVEIGAGTGRIPLGALINIGLDDSDGRAARQCRCAVEPQRPGEKGEEQTGQHEHRDEQHHHPLA